MTTKLPVRRTLQPAARVSRADIVKWTDRSGTEIALNVDLARELFKTKYPLSDAEVMVFLHQARSMGANPFRRDLMPVKYTPQDPVSLIAGYHYLMSEAKRNPRYRPFRLWYVNADGKRIPDGLETEENVVAAVCEVPIEGEGTYKFVARMKEFNKGVAQWKTMPLVMLGKCAIGNAHRLADPGLAGMYLAEELGQGYSPTPTDDITDTDWTDAAMPAAADASMVGPTEGQAEPAAPTTTASPGSSESADDIAKRVCPKCQKKLRLNKPKDGSAATWAPFIGCSGYKKGDSASCDYTEKWEAPTGVAETAAPSGDSESTLDKIKQDAAVLWPAKEGMKEKYDQAKLGAWLNDQFGVGALGGLNEAQAVEAYDRISVMVDEKADGEGAA